MSLLGYSLMAPGAVNYLIGAEEDRNINEEMEERDIIRESFFLHNPSPRQSVWGMCCEEKAVSGGDQQVRLRQIVGGNRK